MKDVHIEWFGGEPSLHTSNIFEVISRLKRYCILKKINLTNSINTNLFRVSKSDFEYYKNGDMDQIVTTLAGWKDSHDYYRKDFFQLSTYEKTLENIKKVHEFLPVSICINITRKSMENIDKLINDLNLLNKNNITLTFLRVSDTGISNITKGEILEPVEYIDFLSKLVIKLLVNNFHIALESNFTGKALYCGTQHLDSFTILPNNSITKCVDNCSTDNSIGYIDSRGMHLDEELLKSKLTNPYINKTCKQCFWIPYCNGGCQYCREKKISFCPDEIIDFNTFLYLFVLICMKEKQSVLFKKLLDLNVDNFRRVNFDKIEFI